MTPFEKLGYKVGDRFRVARKGLEDWELKENSIVTLVEDDCSENPYFRDENGRRHCLFSDWIDPIPLKTEAEKRGAKFGVGGVIKVTRSKWVFACEIEGFWRGIAENGVVVSGEPHHFRLDHEPEYREIPFSEATHEQRMDVSALRFDGGPVEQIVQFDNGAYAFTTSDCDYACPITDHLTVRIPS